MEYISPFSGRSYRQFRIEIKTTFRKEAHSADFVLYEYGPAEILENLLYEPYHFARGFGPSSAEWNSRRRNREVPGALKN